MEEDWIVEINELVKKSEEAAAQASPSVNQMATIYRRPVDFSEEKDSFVYTPRIVSFGPYHHGNKSLEGTNSIKKYVVVDFLNKSGEKKLKECIDALKEVVQDLKGAYDNMDLKWKQDEDAFLRLMIFDGCFLHELLCEATESSDARETTESSKGRNHHSHIFGETIRTTYGMSRKVLKEWYQHDVLLLENQLPLLLLEKLHAFQKTKPVGEARKDLYELILKFVAPDITKELQRGAEYYPQYCSHVLHVYRNSLLYMEGTERPKSPRKKHPCLFCLILASAILLMAWMLFMIVEVTIIIIIGGPLAVFLIRLLLRNKPLADTEFFIPSATELNKVGIVLKMNQSTGLYDIKFRGCTLYLPSICVDGASQSRYHNVIALEQLQLNLHVTSYIHIMSQLIQVADDVRLLQLCYIMDTTLDNEEVVKLFKSLAKNIYRQTFTVMHCTLAKRLNESFYGRTENAWQKEVWQTCFRSPWAFVTVMAGFVLFVLTAIQTVYGVLGEH